MTPQAEILILSCIVAIACASVGVFLVLRKVSLMSDAISHAILLGIVASFFIIGDIDSPLILIAAALSGVLTVALTELLIGTRKMKEDASIGLVFPVFFSLGVILISKYAGDIHLDVDAVLLGELAFAPFDRAQVLGFDVARSIAVMGAILIAVVLFIALFYKELKLTTFDEGLSVALGFSPALMHYAFMSIVSITAVGAFDAVGSILVVALMIAPPSAAYLLTRKLSVMIALSAGIGILSALFGYALARAYDANIAGSIAMAAGAFFLLALLFSPKRGIVAQMLSHKEKSLRFKCHLLLVHLLAHEKTPQEKKESAIAHIAQHMRWNEKEAHEVVKTSQIKEWITKKEQSLSLTPTGKMVAMDAMRHT